MVSIWTVVFVLLMVINQKCSAISSEVEGLDTISEVQQRCVTEQCADGHGYQSVRDAPETFKRRPLRQSAPVKCGDTGLPPPCGPRSKKSDGSKSVHKNPKFKGFPKTHQTAPVTCGNTKLPPPCH